MAEFILKLLDDYPWASFGLFLILLAAANNIPFRHIGTRIVQPKAKK